MADPVSITALVLQSVSFLRRLLPQHKSSDVIVTSGHGFEVWSFEPGGLGELVIWSHATNDGQRPVVIESAGLTLDNGATVLPPPAVLQTMPARLLDGEKQSCLVQIEPLVAQLAERPEAGLPKYAWFRDSASREYRCKIGKSTRETVLSHLESYRSEHASE